MVEASSAHWNVARWAGKDAHSISALPARLERLRQVPAIISSDLNAHEKKDALPIECVLVLNARRTGPARGR